MGYLYLSYTPFVIIKLFGCRFWYIIKLSLILYGGIQNTGGRNIV